MAEIVKVFKQEIPAMRFIGKEYSEFRPWSEWFENGWFDRIESAMGGSEVILNIWEDGGGYVGLERRPAHTPFEYWIGMFVPENTEVPEGFSYMDFDKGRLGVCWIYGSEDDVHDTCVKCRPMLEAAEWKLFPTDRAPSAPLKTVYARDTQRRTIKVVSFWTTAIL